MDQKPPQPALLNITIELIDNPDSKDYPQKAQDTLTAWGPFISQFLDDPKANPPRSIKLVFQKGLRAPVLSSGDTISVKVDWINSRPNDLGMLIYAYTCIVQQYPGNQLGHDSRWISTGIADYMRYVYYEVQPDNVTNPTPSDSWFTSNQPRPTDTYKSGYGNAARFLYWISKKYNVPDLVSQLNKLQRQGKYQPNIFTDLTGTSIDDLWNIYAKELGLPDPKGPLEITIEIIDKPEGNAQSYPQKAKDLVNAWDPFITKILAGEGFTPIRSAKFVFKKGLFAPAYTCGDIINVNVDWINSHPDDLGMMIHEYTHIVQKYPGNQLGYDFGWLTEGIADYIRYIYFEVQPNNPTNPTPSESWFLNREPKPSNTYKSGYGIAARFLYWISKKYNMPDFVTKLNVIQRQGKFHPSVFVDLTGKSVNDLWDEYAAELGVPHLKAPLE